MLSGAIRLGIAVALCLAVAAPAMAQRDYRALSGRVDQIFRDVDRRDAPGAAVVVVWNGEVVHRGGYGTANLEEGTPVTPSTVFDIASLSKQFAGMAIAMLVEQGAISPDDDIRDYIPEVPDLGDTITVGHLLHHTSGLRDWPPTLTVAGWQMDDAIALEDVLGMVRNQRELNFAPGSEYSYSNTGYNLLALLVARVTGQSFPEWTAEHILRKTPTTGSPTRSRRTDQARCSLPSTTWPSGSSTSTTLRSAARRSSSGCARPGCSTAGGRSATPTG
jgi:CubicO group peptidase (beta-lactamase class C family)